MNDTQPGQTVTPQPQNSDTPQLSQTNSSVADAPVTPAPVQPAISESVQTSPTPPVPPAPASTATLPEVPWQTSVSADQESAAPLPQEDINWTAAEFVEHHKNSTWYLRFIGGGIVLVALVYLISRDKISTGIVLFAVIAFAVYAGRKPKTQQYSITSRGILVGAKAYGFHDFKNFSIAEDEATVSIVFMPLKRFMPPLTIYVLPDVEDKVVEYLSSFLPFDYHKVDAVESLMRRIRF